MQCLDCSECISSQLEVDNCVLSFEAFGHSFQGLCDNLSPSSILAINKSLVQLVSEKYRHTSIGVPVFLTWLLDFRQSFLSINHYNQTLKMNEEEKNALQLSANLTLNRLYITMVGWKREKSRCNCHWFQYLSYWSRSCYPLGDWRDPGCVNVSSTGCREGVS